MTLPQFQNSNTASAVTLDANFQKVASNAVIPVSISGTNIYTLTPTPSTATPSLAAYANHMLFCGVIPATNTGTVTLQAGALTALNGFIDTPSGPRQAIDGELQQNNLLLALYDAALGSGAGGFHLFSTTPQQLFMGSSLSSIVLNGLSASSVQIGSAGARLNQMPSSLVSISLSAINPGGTSIATIGLVGARITNNVLIGLPSAVSTGIAFDGFVEGNDVVVVRALNFSTGTVTPTGGIYRLSALGFV